MTTPPENPIARLGDRSLFPDLTATAYLNHSAISPYSAPVQDKLRELAADYAHRGIDAFFRWRETLGELKGQLGGLIGAQAEDIALTPNTTYGVTAIALCFPWERGDKVIVFEGEFPTNVTPWQRAADLFGLEVVSLKVVDFMDDAEIGLKTLKTALETGGVALAAVSAVQFQTGLAMPLKQMAALCHEHGAKLFVDAIQAVGSVPIDVEAMGIDFLTCGSHKWLMGPEGAGFLFARPGLAQTLRPHLAGWLSHEEPVRFLLEGKGHLRYDRPIRQNIDFLEGGASNVTGLVALTASVGLLEQLGVQAIYEHLQAYCDGLEAGLVERGFTSLRTKYLSGRSGILSALPPEGVDGIALWQRLNDRGVSCSIPDGNLRFAPHWPNSLAEIPIVLGILDSSM